MFDIKPVLNFILLILFVTTKSFKYILASMVYTDFLQTNNFLMMVASIK